MFPKGTSESRLWGALYILLRGEFRDVYDVLEMKMMNRKVIIHAAALLLGMASVAQALPAPQALFNQLAAPVSSAPMQPEKRASLLPALAFLPAEGDVVLAARCSTAITAWLIQTIGEGIGPDLEKGLSSISSSALVVGEGGGLALREALPFVHSAGMLQAMRACEDAWCSKARPEHVPCIRRAFEEQRRLEREGLLSSLERFSPPPTYYAITVREGREQDFAVMYRHVIYKLRRVAQENPAVQFVEHGGYAGIRMSWLAAMEYVMGPLHLSNDVRRALLHRELYLLTRNRGRAAVVIACCRLSDIVLPPTPEYSMLYSPRLDGADAHIDSLIATAWVGAPFQRAICTAMGSANAPLLQACVNALRLIGETDSQHQPILNRAADQLAWLSTLPTPLDETYGALTIQCWKDPNGVMIESVGDSGAMFFKPGELRLAHQAAAQGMMFYLESTAFAVPRMPNLDYFIPDFQAALFDVFRGVALTLKEGEQGASSVYVRCADQLRDQIAMVSGALRQVGNGLASPFAILIGRVADEGGEEPACAWGFGAAVRNRAALSGGWHQLLSAAGQAAEKLGIPSGIVRMLPISERDLGNGSVAYSTVLSSERAGMFPGVALNNQYFVLGGSDGFNAHVLSSATGNVPFCGAVSFIHVSRLAKALKKGLLPPPFCPGECASRLTGLMEYLARSVESVYSISTITDGIRTARALVVPIRQTASAAPAP